MAYGESTMDESPSPTNHASWTNHILYVLLDSNLPTGGFVASGGLESYAKHGFLRPQSAKPYERTQAGPIPGLPPSLGHGVSRGSGVSGADESDSKPNGGGKAAPGPSGYRSTAQQARPAFGSSPSARPTSAAPLGPSRAGVAIMEFARAEMENFNASTGWYLREAWTVVRDALYAASPFPASSGDIAAEGIGNRDNDDDDEDELAAWANGIVTRIVGLDDAHESTLLSHVARRASRTQGIAFLSLHSRGLGRPPGFADEVDEWDGLQDADVEAEEDISQRKQGDPERERRASAIIAEYRRLIRCGSAPGHLAVCWGVMTAVLGMDLDTSHHLYLFTHARSALSAGVRLNVIGPYLSTQLLAHPVRKLLASTTRASRRTYALDLTSTGATPDGPTTETSNVRGGNETLNVVSKDQLDGSFWDWAEEAERGPATTWPLGEILAGRHDLQHSRIFNS